MIARIIRVFKLDSSVFREVAEDQTSMTQATIIVVLVNLLSALGGAIGMAFAKSEGIIGSFFYNWIIGGILLGWIGWAILTYFVGTLLFKGKTDIREMLRVLGFSSAPRVLGILGIIPCLGWIASLIGAILALVAGVIAIREAMEFDTTKAIITVVIGWVIMFVLALVIGLVLGLGAAIGSGLTG